MVILFIVKFLTFFTGCLSCFILHSHLNVPAVVASSLVGLFATYIPFSKRYQKHSVAAVYAGSFAGMCSLDLISSYWELGAISLIGASLYIMTMNLFEGFGGKLGSVAFISVALFILARGI